MNLRRYKNDDLEAVAQLYTESIHTNAASHYDVAQRGAWAPRPPDLDIWRRRMATLQMLLAEEDGRLCGMLGYEDNGHIDLLFTAPGCARRGVASALYCAAESALAAQGLNELFTEASLVAHPFFLRQGFEVVEAQRINCRGVVLPRFAMRKRLAPCP
ncbi:GNAT family N-acetyltransferase [Sinimarinibacterium sp. CAU 1509]|uniref:GNAT family N-acetyltransferase n=1 Tax=Sinimarinibacterium sp. CAU 1509 TaxID=2562283 RepID=UPI0010AC7248|nr:GNAT family N-acetyltransferase [Sinimarinibacterium sp. CAU 1509]TJY59995.1 GNAT family N-acetyltransferase [Sinimarinibacterium sp. CAU 1509]